MAPKRKAQSKPKPAKGKELQPDQASATQAEIPTAKRQRKPKEGKKLVEQEPIPDPAPKRPATATANLNDSGESDTEAKPKKSGKTEPNKAAPLNATVTKWHSVDFGCNKKNAKGESYNLKITSWNVDGLRAWLKKDGINILTHDKPDILCLQETKCSESKLPEEVKGVGGYHDFWCSSQKEGYAGVAVYTKIEPIKVTYGIDSEEHDDEGRCITLEFKNYYLVNVYVPNAGRGLVTLPKRLDWNEIFKDYIKKLDQKKPVIMCGDMNVAHNEIDLSNPKTNKKNAGFTQEERDGMTDFLEQGFTDSFRELYPEQENIYTFWSYMSKARARNIGWRLDYFILSNRITEKVCDSVVRSEVFGSDHCSITLFLNI